MIFRRKGLALAPWYGLMALMWVFSGAFALAFFAAVFTIRPFTWSDLFVTALIGFGAWPPGAYAWALRGSIRYMRTYYLRIGEEGVRFHLPGAGEVQVAWRDMQAVTREKVWVNLKGPFPFAYRNYVYTIVTDRGRFTFSTFEIPRPERAAREIAAKTGQEVQRIAR
jgi:hypothetical protein